MVRDATALEMPADLQASLLAALRAQRGPPAKRDVWTKEKNIIKDRTTTTRWR